MDIADIHIALYPHHPPFKDFFPFKTLIYSNVHSYKSTHSTAAPPTLSLIPSTPNAASSTTATPTSTENIKVYSVIAVSVHINIVYK